MRQNSSTVAESLVLAEKLREAVHTVRVESNPVTISCGVAVASASLSIDNAVELADAAMYQAKRDGRDRTVSIDRTPTIDHNVRTRGGGRPHK